MMIFNTTTRLKHRLAFALIFSATFLSTSAVHAAGWWPGSKIDFELTGQVLDIDTNEPIEGAYAIALYEEGRSGIAGSRSFCVKTKGMYTGKDGRFHFPVEKRDGYSPSLVNAVRSGYFFAKVSFPPRKIHEAQNAEAYTNRHVYLRKQDVNNPNFQYNSNEFYCSYGKTLDDVKASITFSSLVKEEYVRFGAPQQGRDSLTELIRDLESRPSISNIPAK
jgi:hypothetical protein